MQAETEEVPYAAGWDLMRRAQPSPLMTPLLEELALVTSLAALARPHGLGVRLAFQCVLDWLLVCPWTAPRAWPMLGRSPAGLRADYRLTENSIQGQHLTEGRGPPPRGAGSFILAWLMDPTTRCAYLWPAVAAEGLGRDIQQGLRPPGHPQPDAAAALEALLLLAGCVTADEPLQPDTGLRFSIRVAGRPGRDVGALPGSVVAVVYRLAPGATTLVERTPGPRNHVVARLLQVPDAQRVPLLWMAVNLSDLDSQEVKYIILVIVAALGPSSAHWAHTGLGGVPSLGLAHWSPSVGWAGPNLIGSWSGNQQL
jgi:hypothetical protein